MFPVAKLLFLRKQNYYNFDKNKQIIVIFEQ